MKPKICRHLIVVFLYLCCFPDFVSAKLVVELKPDNPFVYIGDILELNCTASDAVADLLVFHRGNFRIDSKFLQKLNNSTIQASLPITEEDKDIRTYICEFDNFSLYSVQNLKIEYKPRPVENLTCQIYNWETLTCTWDLGPYIKLEEMHVSVAWEHSMMYGNFTVENDKSKFHHDFRFYSYNFTITVSHKQTGEQDVSVNKTYDMPKIEVKPAAVNKLLIISEENQCVILKFEHDLYHSNADVDWKNERELKIRVTYSSKWELQPWVVDKLMKEDSMTVCNVHPYSKYKFDVDVLPIKRHGVWSDIKSVEYTTNPTVPGSGPKTTNGSYYQGLCVNNERKVTLFIQHIAERLTHGIMDKYTAVYTPISSGQQLTESVPSTAFVLDYSLKCSTDYLVELKATNSFGTSTNNTFIYIPKLQELAPFESDARLLVNVFKETNTSDKNVVAKWIGFKSQPLYYKLFWCQSSSIRCEGDINWVEVEGDVTNKIIRSDTLNIEDVEARKYIFSISAVYKRNISTPMIFANCIYQSWTVPKNPPQLQLDKKNPERSLRVSWKYETCHSQSLVYIQSYNIYHCPTDEHGNCTAKYITEKVDSRISNYQLTDLKAETNYSVWMQPVSPGGLGPESEKLYGVPYENHTLSGSEITGIVFGILFAMSLIFFIISRICCSPKIYARNAQNQSKFSQIFFKGPFQTLRGLKYWHNCCKKYVIKEIKIKEEGMKSGYDEIGYINDIVEINGEEQVNQKETPKLKTQISDDSGTFSLPNSPSVRGEHLPSISEEVYNSGEIKARSLSEMFNEKRNGEEKRNQMKVSSGEAESYFKMDLLTDDSTKMSENNVDNIQSSVLSERRLLGIAMNNLLPAPGNSTKPYISSEAILSEKHAVSNGFDAPYVSNNLFIQLPPAQSSIHNSSSSASSSSPTSQSTGTDGDSAPPYIHVTGINQNSSQSESSNVSGNQIESALLSANEGTLQPAQEISKLDIACSSSDKQTSPYVFLPTSNTFQDPQIIQVPQHQNPSSGESRI